jgi:hypothetical protein
MSLLAPSAGREWTEAELVEIRRLKGSCERHGHQKLTCDQTDAGDPWCVIYDRTSDNTLLHLARIDRRYVVVFLRNKTATHWFSTIRAAVDLALLEVSSD